MALTKIGATLGGSADVITVTQASHGLTLGYPVKMGSNGNYAHATADTAANAEVVGIIIATTTNTLTIALGGRITVDGCVPNVTAGTVLFLQVSAGLLAATEPSSTNQVSKPMAVVTVANSEMIMVQQRGEVIGTGTVTIADGSIDNDAMADDAIGADELAANAVVNASVASGAAIEFSKMENLTASRALVSDGNGDVSVSAVTSTEVGYLDGVTSAIQTQIDAAGGDFSNGGDAGALVLGTNDSNSLTLETNNTARMVLAAAGDVTISTGNVVIGTAGKGIDFSAQTQSTAYTAASEVLDHYEEGNWTPVLEFGGGTTGITYANSGAHQNGEYTRIGDMVFLQAYIMLSSKGSSTGNARITGIPFTTNNENDYAVVSMQGRQMSYDGHQSGMITTTSIGFGEIAESGTYSALTNANFANNTEISITVGYQVPT